MPRKPKVTTLYQKAGQTPSKRKPSRPVSVQMPRGLSPLTQYVEDNLDSEIPVLELIHQFQEYDCEHEKLEIVATSAEIITERCTSCWKLTMRTRPGVKQSA